MQISLKDLAQRFGLELKGNGAVTIDGMCTLAPGEPGRLAFLANPKYRAQLAGTQASAVIVGPRDAAALTRSGLIAPDPYLTFARIAALFDSSREFMPGVHPSAVIASDARIGTGVHIGAFSVIEQSAQVGDGVFVGAHCSVGAQAEVGAGSHLEARVWLGERVRLGARCRLSPGAVVGSRGFGLARGPQGWEEVPQLGSVIVGDDVEIGANTTIDRGAIGDTIIENGVKLDNQIQIAHNCHVGAHTAIAACTGIAGSTRIGARCMIGGAVGISGHIDICDDVVLLGRAMVTNSITEKGVYGSGLPLAPAPEWRKTVARVRRLQHYEQRLREIEHKLTVHGNEGESVESDD